MNHLKSWAITLAAVLVLSVNGWGCGEYEDGAEGAIQLGEAEQPILVESQFGWRSGSFNNTRCQSSSANPDCVLPEFKGMNIVLGAGWTTTERQTLLSLFTANSNALKVAAPSWTGPTSITGTSGASTCGPAGNHMCVLVNKVAGNAVTGNVRPTTDFALVGCTQIGGAIVESPTTYPGTWRYCDKMTADVAAVALTNWSGGTFSAGNNDWRQITGHIVALRAGLGTRGHGGVETMTSDSITKNVNANNSLFGNESCEIEHYVCNDGAVGCDGINANLGVGAACPIETL